MIRQSLDALARFSPQFRRLMMRTWYEALVVIDREKQITFMNYGYAEPEGTGKTLVLPATDEANRYAIQMYHHVASAIDLTGKDVVEIGSGRGGGAAYVAATFNPKSVLGIDISKKAVDFCNRYYSTDRLSFKQGDAENIPLANNSVDVVINIESSHCYGSMERFVHQVSRILRPDGYFLFADHRDDQKLPTLRKQFQDGSLEIVSETDMTSNVVRALDLDNDRRKELIHDACSPALRRQVEEFAAVVGTRTYESFNEGASRYVSFRLQKRV